MKGMIENPKKGLTRIKEALASMPLSVKLCLLFLIALTPRFIVFLQPQIITNDGILYIKMAKQFAEGKYSGTLGSYFSFYPFLIFLVQKLVGDWELSGQLISVVLGALAVIPVFLLGRSLYNEKMGWLSAIFYIALPNLLKFNSQVIRDPTLWFFFLFAMWFVWEGSKKNQTILFALASVSSGLGAITRVEGFIVFSVLFLYMAFKKAREISLKSKILNLSLYVLIFPFLLSLALFSFKKSSGEMAIREMTSFSVSFITAHARQVLKPPDPIDTMGEKSYSSLPVISQNSLELATRHRFVLAVSEVIYKFIKSTNFLIILVLLGLWKRMKEGILSPDRYLLYILTALFIMSILYVRQLYYFSTRHGLTLVLPTLFFAGHGLDYVVELTSRGLNRFLRWTGAQKYLLHIITVLLVILFLGQGLSERGEKKVIIKEAGIWLKQKGYQSSLIMGPPKYFRLAFYAEAEFLKLPDSWEKAVETILQRKVQLVVIDSSTIEQDCPGFLGNWEHSGLVLLQEIKGKRKTEKIQIYLIQRYPLNQLSF